MQNKQQITITDKSSVEITSVICVKTLDDSGILVETTLGLLSVEGSELRIENFEKATNEQWEKYANNFDPDLFDPEEWAECATGRHCAAFY